MRPRVALLAACGLVAACGPRPAAAGPESCGPTEATLEPGIAGTTLKGTYRVRLVATTGPRRDSSTDGTIVLTSPAVSGPDSTARRFALVGSGNLALTEVGAAEADVASRDPMRPGVLVFDLGPGAAGGPNMRVLLRLGAEANRQDVVRLEGAYTVLRVHQIRDDGFTGRWMSGAPLPVAEGYYCASRDEPRAQ